MALAAAGLALVGCGGDDEEMFRREYRPVNERLLDLGVLIAEAPLAPGRDRDAKLARRYGRYATDLTVVNRDLEDLDPPGELEDDSEKLMRSIETVVKDLETVADAARRRDRRARSLALGTLADHANDVNRIQNKLARATGADIGLR